MYSIRIFFVAFISLVEAIDEFALNISIVVHNVRRTVEQHAEIPVDCCLSFVCVCVQQEGCFAFSTGCGLYVTAVSLRTVVIAQCLQGIRRR